MNNKHNVTWGNFQPTTNKPESTLTTADIYNCIKHINRSNGFGNNVDVESQKESPTYHSSSKHHPPGVTLEDFLKKKDIKLTSNETKIGGLVNIIIDYLRYTNNLTMVFCCVLITMIIMFVFIIILCGFLIYTKYSTYSMELEFHHQELVSAIQNTGDYSNIKKNNNNNNNHHSLDRPVVDDDNDDDKINDITNSKEEELFYIIITFDGLYLNKTTLPNCTGWIYKNTVITDNDIATSLSKFNQNVIMKQTMEVDVNLFNGKIDPIFIDNAFIMDNIINNQKYNKELSECCCSFFFNDMFLLDPSMINELEKRTKKYHRYPFIYHQCVSLDNSINDSKEHNTDHDEMNITLDCYIKSEFVKDDTYLDDILTFSLQRNVIYIEPSSSTEESEEERYYKKYYGYRKDKNKLYNKKNKNRRGGVSELKAVVVDKCFVKFVSGNSQSRLNTKLTKKSESSVKTHASSNSKNNNEFKKKFTQF